MIIPAKDLSCYKLKNEVNRSLLELHIRLKDISYSLGRSTVYLTVLSPNKRLFNRS